jgi:hypothetical protein
VGSLQSLYVRNAFRETIQMSGGSCRKSQVGFEIVISLGPLVRAKKKRNCCVNSLQAVVSMYMDN